MAEYFAMKRLEDLGALAALDALDDDERVELLRTGALHLKRGDFLHAEAGSAHDALWSDEGGMALLVISREDDLAYSR